jgi:hypothetical protein
MADATAARAAAESLSAVLEQNDFVGWDPYDALASPAIRTFARTRFLRQASIQAVKGLPFNPRPLLGVPRTENSKALALFVSAYSRLARLEPNGRFAGLALTLADRLEQRALRVGGGAGWGYPFDVQTRWGYYPGTLPNAVATSFAVHALMDVEPLAAPGRFTATIESALEYAGARLLTEQGETAFYAYYEGSTVPIHNASLLVASTFARRGRGEEALSALRYSLGAQAADGSWPYGPEPGLGWVDAYHTAFILWALDQASNDSPRAEGIDGAIARGLDFFLHALVDEDGAVRASPDARYPIDIHSCSSSVWALSALHDRDPRVLEAASRILDWTLAHMRREDGRFAFQRRRLFRASVPYARWSDGHMLLALSEFLLASS